MYPLKIFCKSSDNFSNYLTQEQSVNYLPDYPFNIYIIILSVRDFRVNIKPDYHRARTIRAAYKFYTIVKGG